MPGPGSIVLGVANLDDLSKITCPLSVLNLSCVRNVAFGPEPSKIKLSSVFLGLRETVPPFTLKLL